MIGRRLAQYEILEKIGSGGMGEVYRARDTTLGREVALKILPPDLASDPERSARFETEARAVAALRHPSIVTIHGIDEADGVRFMAMEMVEGKTLTQLIPAGGFSLSEFLDIAIPLADAIAAAHAKGVTHRDLKPDNVMVEPDGRIKVLDFGLAKLLEVGLVGDGTVTVGPRVTQSGRIMGTVAYMSPEQAEGKPVDPRSDVFSLGIVLYEMITGDRPFQGDTHISTITAILRDTPLPVHERKGAVPRQLDRIVQRCLEKAPDRRYETARGLKNDLESLRVETTSQPSVPAKSLRAQRGFPWIPLGMVVVIAGLIAGRYFLRTRIGGEGSAAPSAPSKPATIVVFPFENLGPAGDQYFAAGISEEITSRLSALAGLGVVSRTSATQYDRKGKTMAAIATDLGVDYVLDGTVRWARSGDGTSEVRITPQLTRAREDRQVWSASYDRSMDQIFKIQSEIAGEVVEKLGMAVGGKERQALEAAPTSNVEAYHAYLRAKELIDSIRFSRDDLDRGVTLLEDAVAKDPQFLRAWAELAKAEAGYNHFSYDISEERLAKSKAALDRAVALDADSPYTQIAVGYYHYWGRKEYSEADAAFSKAQAGFPSSADVAQAIAMVRRRQGRFEEAAAQLQKALALDPENGLDYYTLGETQTVLRRYEEARRSFDRCIALSPNPTTAIVSKARLALLQGDVAQAKSLLAEGGQERFDIPESRGVGFWVAIGCRDYDLALNFTETMEEAVNAQFGFECRAASRGLALSFKGDEKGARAEFEKALVALDRYASSHPDGSNVRSIRGIVLAKLGRGEDGLREAQLALTLRPASIDMWVRRHRTHDLAAVEIFAGKKADAIKHLGELLAEPSDRVSVALLRQSPVFDPLRNEPEFEALCR